MSLVEEPGHHLGEQPAPLIEYEPDPRPVGVVGWITTGDHKKIGILYMVTAFIFFLFAAALALVFRTQLIVPNNNFLSLDVFNQLFTMHGTIMLFVFLGPFAFGLANYIVPLQIGAPDMAFPRFNNLSYWLYLGGFVVMTG